MSAEKYSNKISKIRRKLRSYRADSVLQKVYDHLHWSGTNNPPALGMPWIVLFLLKLAMQECRGDRKIITSAQFTALANELFHMQGLAIPIGPGNPHLLLRPMILQQAWYQGEVLADVKAMTRQMAWYAQPGSPYDEMFKKNYGLTLEHFYLISLYLIILVANQSKGVAEINLVDLLFRLTPSIPLESVVRYFLLTSVRSQDLPAFFLSHTVPGELHQQSEFLQTTPLRHKPILADGNNLFILNGKFFSRAIGTLMPALLKKMKGWSFKEHFGPDMEKYIGDLLSHSKVTHLTETELNAKCRLDSVITGKMADYMITGKTNVIIESKAIEPGDIISAVFDPGILKAHLKDSFIKAIEQCQESVFRLKQTKVYSDGNFSCIIVTHEDFWFASAVEVASFIDFELTDRILAKFGSIPVPMEKILFISIDMLESTLASHANSDIEIGEFIEECSVVLGTAEGRRFTMTHLIQDKLGDKLKGHELLTSNADTWHNFFEEKLSKNSASWIGNHLELMRSSVAAKQIIHRALERLQAVRRTKD
ncbi:GapS1 family protein [Pseudomonas asiatica]|uniref:GapS1 family protein n=1 Tax=Pseudomonas asiatica TaxID=2219225 RepID=UPI0018A994AD|nr:hypothetical protein [Pseudomonas asiatica]MBF8803504.1 hypothetical protein [Pseudomonas asiatica]